MEIIATVLAFYVVFGLLLCLILSFRRRKHPNAVMASDLIVSGGPFALPIFILLWPLFLWMQRVEEKDLKDENEYRIEEKKEDLNELIGRIGRTVTPMVPSGRINLGDKDYEAISDEGKMDRDEKVEVIAFSMGTLKVKRFQPVGPYNSGQALRA